MTFGLKQVCCGGAHPFEVNAGLMIRVPDCALTNRLLLLFRDSDGVCLWRWGGASSPCLGFLSSSALETVPSTEVADNGLFSS